MKRPIQPFTHREQQQLAKARKILTQLFNTVDNRIHRFTADQTVAMRAAKSIEDAAVACDNAAVQVQKARRFVAFDCFTYNQAGLEIGNRRMEYPMGETIENALYRFQQSLPEARRNNTRQVVKIAELQALAPGRDEEAAS